MSNVYSAGLQSDLQKLRIPELKALCRQQGLAVSGTKAALIARLSVPARIQAPTAATSTSSSAPADHVAPAAVPSARAAIATATIAADSLITESFPDRDESIAFLPTQFSAELPTLAPQSKRALPETTIIPDASSRSTKLKNSLFQTSTSQTVSPAGVGTAALPGGFQRLHPPKSARKSDHLPARSTTTSASGHPPKRAPLTYADLTRQYAWLLPLLGRETFHSFLPSKLEGDSLRAVAVYLSTRTYCLLGQLDTDSAPTTLTHPILCIVSVERVTPDVYRCSFEDDIKHTFVGITGEIIASGDQLRGDWSALLASSTLSQDAFDLTSLVKNQDVDSFDRGISRAFRQRLSQMRDKAMANELLAIAESYVIAHVAPKAISGAWQSLHQQCAEFAGLSQSEEAWSKVKQTVKLFLPNAHLIESVTAAGLHESLAIVQTLHRSHFVFRLTGQIVGEGDEGVLPLFQDVLGCDYNGRSLHSKC